MPHQIQTMEGFTLLEVLLSIALISLIAGIGAPLYQSFQVRNDLNIGATTAVNVLRRAETLARASDGDTSWGVSFTAGSLTLFRGTSYATRNAAYDEVFSIPTNISFSGTTDYVFARFTGLPISVGTTTLSSSIGETRTITVHAKGMVE